VNGYKEAGGLLRAGGQRTGSPSTRRCIARSVKPTGYIVDSLCTQAEMVLADQNHFVSLNEKWDAFLKALDAPPQVPPRLKRLLSREPIPKCSDLQKGILDPNAAQHGAMLKVFALEKIRARQTCRVNDHRLPKGNSIQPMQLNSRYHIVFHKAHNSRARQ